MPSRRATSDDLMESSLWWNGPHGMDHIDDIKSEIKCPKILFETSAVVQVTCEVKSSFGINEDNYSSLSKLLNVNVHVPQFQQKVKKGDVPQGSQQLMKLRKQI